MSENPLAGASGPRISSEDDARDDNVSAHPASVTARPVASTHVLNTAAPEPVSLNENSDNARELEEEISTIEDLKHKVERVEEELRKQKIPDRVPMVSNPESPFKEEQ